MHSVFCILPWSLLAILVGSMVAKKYMEERATKSEMSYMPGGEVIVELSIPDYIRSSPSIFENFRKVASGRVVESGDPVNTPIMQLSVMVPTSSQSAFEKTYKYEEKWYDVLQAYDTAKRKHSRLIITIFNTDEGESFGKMVKFKGLTAVYSRVDGFFTCKLQNKMGTEIYHQFEFPA